MPHDNMTIHDYLDSVCSRLNNLCSKVTSMLSGIPHGDVKNTLAENSLLRALKEYHLIYCFQI